MRGWSLLVLTPSGNRSELYSQAAKSSLSVVFVLFLASTVVAFINLANAWHEAGSLHHRTV